MQAVDLHELRDLTDYGNRFHHDSNPQGYLTVVVTDAELRGFVQRTLAFLQQTVTVIPIISPIRSDRATNLDSGVSHRADRRSTVRRAHRVAA